MEKKQKARERPEASLLRKFFSLFLEKMKFEAKIQSLDLKMDKIKKELEPYGIIGSKAEIAELAHIQLKAEVEAIPLSSMRL